MAATANLAELALLPRTAEEARLCRSLHYFTGRPCRRGHVEKRLTSAKCCIACRRDNNRAFDTTHRSRRNAFRGSREKKRAFLRAYNKANASAVNAYNAGRRASRARREPAWLSAAQRQQMRSIYALARATSKATSVAHEVDHIVPLHGLAVSGLHVPWNLRVIAAEANRKKYNKFQEA